MGLNLEVPERGPHRRPARAARWTSSASAPTTSSSTCWPWTAPTRGCPHLYQPLHPAVLRVIQEIVRAGEARRLPVSLCGEMAADPLQALVLLGLGVRELSMSPAAIPRVKDGGARGARGRGAGGGAVLPCLSLATAAEIEAMLGRELASALPGPPAPQRSERMCREIPKRVDKPWGYEIWWARTDRYVGKILHLNKGESLSLQYHRVKDETIRLQSGRLLFETAAPAAEEPSCAASRWRRATSSTSRPAPCTA